MADMGAIERATGGAPAPEVGPAPEVAPQGSGMEVLAEGMQAINAFLSSQAEQGNPAAEQAMGAFQQLVESMKGLVGGGEAAPVEAPAEGGQVPLQEGVVI